MELLRFLQQNTCPLCSISATVVFEDIFGTLVFVIFEKMRNFSLYYPSPLISVNNRREPSCWVYFLSNLEYFRLKYKLDAPTSFRDDRTSWNRRKLLSIINDCR